MGVSVEGGKGRGKSMGVDLNLVPFIDFLSCLIAFLMMTAVMSEIHSIAVEQNVSPPDPNQIPPDPPPPKPLTVHVEADALFVCRDVATGTRIPLVPESARPKDGDPYDWGKLEELLVKDHEALPLEELAVINTDDGVEYGYMAKALDLTRKVGYPKTALSGGPASALTDMPPAAPAGATP